MKVFRSRKESTIERIVLRKKESRKKLITDGKKKIENDEGGKRVVAKEKLR